jgi:hypothetical protein
VALVPEFNGRIERTAVRVSNWILAHFASDTYREQLSLNLALGHTILTREACGQDAEEAGRYAGLLLKRVRLAEKTTEGRDA